MLPGRTKEALLSQAPLDISWHAVVSIDVALFRLPKIMATNLSKSVSGAGQGRESRLRPTTRLRDRKGRRSGPQRVFAHAFPDQMP